MIQTPPYIAGNWKGKSSVLTQHPGQHVDLFGGITHFEKIYTVEQNNIFVTWTSQADGGRPVVLTQLGIWNPVFRDGEVRCWELQLTDYDDNQTGVVQIVGTDRKGAPIKLYRTSIESGFSSGNTIQKSEVISTVLTRCTSQCDHTLTI